MGVIIYYDRLGGICQLFVAAADKNNIVSRLLFMIERKTGMSQKREEKKPWDRDLEAEAAFLERQALAHIETMPEEDEEAEFARLMERIEERKKEKAAGGAAPGMEKEASDTVPDAKDSGEKDLPGASKRHGRIRWKILGALAAALVLLLALGLGTVGKKVYTPEAVVEHRDGEVVIKVNNDVRIESEVEEEEIYQEINDRLGVLSLRLGYKPQGMELYKVDILEDVGEAILYFVYREQTFSIYISRDYQEMGGCVKSYGDGKIIEVADNFILNEEIEIIKTKNEEGKDTFLSEILCNNVFYVVSGNMEIDEFLKIVEEIYIKNM